MKLVIASSANRLTGWPISFLTDLRVVTDRFVNESYTEPKLARLQLEVQALCERALPPAATSLTRQTPLDQPNNTVFTLAGPAGWPAFTLTASA